MLGNLAPYAQRNWRKTLRGLMKWAKSERLIEADPTAGVELTKTGKSLGHMTMGEEQIATYREHHKLGSMARLAIELLTTASRLHRLRRSATSSRTGAKMLGSASFDATMAACDPTALMVCARQRVVDWQRQDARRPRSWPSAATARSGKCRYISRKPIERG
jgi:hypothetical protein